MIVEKFLWTCIISLLVSGVSGYYYFADKSLLLRIIGLLVACAIAFMLSVRTRHGQLLITAWRNALQELRKVIWPTKQETMQTTLAVLAMVVVMSIVLWSIDAGLIRILAWTTGYVGEQ